MPQHQVLQCPWPGSLAQTFPEKGNKGSWASVVQEAAEVGLATQQQITVISLAQGVFCLFYELYVPQLDKL
jgi:hypothetical protein